MKSKMILKNSVNCLTILILFMIFTTVYFLTSVANAAEQRTYRWKFQTHVTSEREVPFKQFAEKVRIASGGRIIMDFFPSGAIVPSSEMASAVSKGTIDCAYTYGAYHSGLIDVGNIESGLPMAWTNTSEAMLFFARGFKELVRQAYDERNIYWVTPSLETPFYLISKKPVKSINDMKKMKIRATATVGALLKEFGIATVYLPSEEFYTALSTGVVDGIIFGSDFAYYSLRLQEQAKNITDIKILDPITMCFIVNKDVWKSLPADLQMIVEEIAVAHFSVDFFGIYANRDKMVKDKKVFTYQPSFSPADVTALTKAAQAQWDKEATKSPRCAKAIEILRSLARDTGRL